MRLNENWIEVREAFYDDVETIAWAVLGALDMDAEDLDLKVLSTTMNVDSRQPIVIDEKEIFDMNGNVWEWCSDYYKTNFYAEYANSSEYRQNGYVENPICDDSEYAAHSFRRGSWRFDAKNCRCTSVNYWISSDTDDDLGFRLALDC